MKKDKKEKGALSSPDLMLVEWEDAATHGGWNQHEEVVEFHKEPFTCLTVGFLWASDKTGITLVQTLGPSCYGALWKIPKGMIKRVSVIKRGRK